MGVRGVFREVAPPSRIVHTERFDEALVPGRIRRHDGLRGEGRSKVTMTLRFETAEARDGVLKSGMERGVAHELRPSRGHPGRPARRPHRGRPDRYLRVTVPRSEIQKVMGPGLQELTAAVARARRSRARGSRIA